METNKNKSEKQFDIGKEWVAYTHYEVADKLTLVLQESFVILFVLDGELTLNFSYTIKKVEQKMMIIIERKQLIDASCSANTKLLEFCPPKKIFRYFISCNRVFSLPSSTIVPMLPQLSEWVDVLLATTRNETILLDKDRYNSCSNLAKILKEYPPRLAEELLVPFTACCMSGEGACKLLCK